MLDVRLMVLPHSGKLVSQVRARTSLLVTVTDSHACSGVRSVRSRVRQSFGAGTPGTWESRNGGCHPH